MLTEKGTMFTEVIFSDDKTERYLLKKVWDESKPIVSLIMTNPSSADAVTIDMTVHYAICNLYALGYGGMEILNITSLILKKMDTKDGLILSDVNAAFITKSAEITDKTILAWGRCGEANKKVQLLQMKLLEKLKPFEHKLFVIANKKGDSGFHPLAPQIRFEWILKPFVVPEYMRIKPDNKQAEQEEQAANEHLRNTSKRTEQSAPDKITKRKQQHTA